LKRDGSIRYVMPDQVETGHAAAKLDRLLAEWVDAIIPAGNMIVLKTPPGSANLVANALDAAGMDEVAGTLAGDDTIFVAITDGTNPQAVASMLQRRRSGA
jgi:transcriptional regulator of arginine metabolism